MKKTTKTKNQFFTKKTIEGYLYNRIEKLGDNKFNHVGFEDEKGDFGDMIVSFVPKVGGRKKARLTIEILNEKKK